MEPLPRPRHPSPVDALLAGFFAFVVLFEAFSEPVVQRPWLHAVVGGVAMVLLAWRRVRPIQVAAAVVAADVVLGLNGGELSVVLALLVMSFTIGSETDGAVSLVGVSVITGAFFAGLVATEGQLIPGDLAAGLVFLVGPWIAGRTLRARAAALGAAMSREARFEQEKLHETEAATARERARLARELHDIVAHSISVIAIQTQAVRRRLGPEQSREATDLAAVESAARDAMVEMRRLFGVLREEGAQAALEPQPGLAELGRLADRVRDTGVAVELETRGQPVGLSPGVDLAAYRIVQEAVTNALRHADARTLTVRVDYEPGALAVTVEDDGRGIDGSDEGDGGGHGLRGIRERAELYGGTLEVGRGAAGGARVHARLPVGSHP